VFWTIATAVLFVAAVITLFPLLRGKSALQPLALALAFILPAAGLWVYDNFGTPDGLDVRGTPRQVNSAADPHAQGGEMGEMLAGLRQRLEQTPDDLDGLMLLARTLKASQQFAEAADVLERAHAVAPENPAVMVELAEAWIYESQDGSVPGSAVAMLERALGINPELQKGLWLMGIASMQQGDDPFAISYWQTLLEQLEPGSNTYNMVAGQINEAQVRMGMLPGDASHEGHDHGDMTTDPANGQTAAVASEDGAWSGTRVILDANDGARQALADGAVLYIMIRGPGPAMGPPLGVRRVTNPSFPLEVTVTDDDSMMKERMISSEAEIRLQARVSLTGTPAAQPGDWNSEAKTIELASASMVVLDIDQQVE
jgi:cytochrome c-type biogenesis protein CcmH